MWIAIVVERPTTVVQWNVRATKQQAVDWVVSTCYPKDTKPVDTDAEALALIEQDGWIVQVEEVEHLATTTEFGLRFPNGLIRNCGDYYVAAYDLQLKADETLRNANSPVVVERHVLITDWQEELG